MWPFSKTAAAPPPAKNVPPELAGPAAAGVPAPPEGGLLAWLRAAVGWPGAGEASRQPGVEKKLDEDRFTVSSGPSGIALPWFAPYLDDQTAEPAAARAAYRKMAWSCPNVSAALKSQINAVQALTLKVVPAGGGRKAVDREAADFLRWNLTERLADGVNGLVWNILHGGLVDGYSVNWKNVEPQESGRWRGKWPLTRLRPLDVQNDLVLRTDEFRNVVDVLGLRYNGGKRFSPSRFLIYRHLPLYNAPVGTSALRAAYGRWWMLDTVIKLRAIHAERNATPMLLGTYQTTAQKATLESSMANARSMAWLSLPESVKVEALSIAGSAADVFKTFQDDMAHDIFIAIAGASLQTLQGVVSDGRGNSQVHAETAELRVLALAKAVESLLNDRESGLVKDIVDINFVVDEYPLVSLISPDTKALADELDILERVAALGVPLSANAIREKFGVEPPDANEPNDAVGVPNDPGPQPGEMDLDMGYDNAEDGPEMFREGRRRRRQRAGGFR